ncbi:MAG: hypothetical protein NTV34_07970 [Proteobacteria bacterium]|nr:hypothetical protein [Pseudomonadota bacterium]
MNFVLILVTSFTMISCGLNDRKENRELRSQNDDLRTESEKARIDESDAKAKSAEEAKQSAELNKALAEKSQAAADAEARLKLAQSDLAIATSQRATLAAEVTQLRSDAAALRDLSTSSEDSFRRALRKRYSLADNATDQEILSAIDARLKEVEELVSANEATIKRVMANNSEQKDEIRKLNKKIAELSISPADSLVLVPFDGIWVAETSPLVSLPIGCTLMIRVAAKGGSIVRAVVCEDETAQIETYSPSDFGVRNDVFPSSLGLAVVGKMNDASCGAMRSTVLTGKEFVFDHSTSVPAERATYMYSSYGSDKNLVFQSASSVPSLGRNKSCEQIESLAGTPASQGNKMLQKAANLCRGSFKKSGCFTSDGFKPAQ